MNNNVIGGGEQVLFKRSFTLKLKDLGMNKMITLPQRLEVYRGDLYLKAYCVQMENNNTDVPEINLNLKGINHLESENNRSDILTLPLFMNGGKTTLVQDLNLVLETSNHRVERNIYYDLLDDNITEAWSGNKPSAVYLIFEYFSAVL